MKLDKKTRQLLFELDRNSRASVAALARKVSLPEETVRYRVRTMFDEGLITTCYPVVGVGNLGMSIHKVMLKLHKAGEAKIGALAKFLVEHPLTNWVARFDGVFDLGCTLWVQDLSELVDFIEELKGRFHAHIKTISHAVNIVAEFYPRDHLLHSKRSKGDSAVYSSSVPLEKRFEFDAHDWALLKCLANDARMSISDMSRSMQVSMETVQRRLRRLEESKVISGYRIVLDHEKAGYLSYYLLLYLNHVSKERLNAFLTHLRAQGCVVYMIKMLGAWDYDVSVELPDVASYRRFMMDLTEHFSDVIRELESLVTWQVMKFSIMPPRKL
jgi:Lrp/AsnC family leucine-responsive transcriptional regulator